MKRIIRSLLFLLYKYYNSGGTKVIAYESALMTASFFVLIHVLQFKVIFWGGGITFGDTRLERYLTAGLFFIPVYLFFRFFFKKEYVLQVEELVTNEKRGYLLILAYTLVSLSILVGLVLLRR